MRLDWIKELITNFPNASQEFFNEQCIEKLTQMNIESHKNTKNIEKQENNNTVSLPVVRKLTDTTIVDMDISESSEDKRLIFNKNCDEIPDINMANNEEEKYSSLNTNNNNNEIIINYNIQFAYNVLPIESDDVCPLFYYTNECTFHTCTHIHRK